MPAYNEEATIVASVRALLQLRYQRFEVIVVNDGSGPDTSAWLRGFCQAHAGFEVIEHETNRGYTCAVNTGLRASRAPYVVTLNSDTIVTAGSQS